MIISHQHRYIFFAIPKTGTHSVRQALRTQLGPDDLEQVGLFEQKRFPFPEFAQIRHGHISTQQIRPVLGDAIFSAYTKFAFVRNPFERFVSYCAFMARETTHFEQQPLHYMKWVIREQKPFDHLLFLPQHGMVTDAGGRLELDFVGRNETMQASYDAICDRLRLERSELGHMNASKHRPYQEYYDRELVDLVSRHYARDLELFEYRFE
ncbi:MAG: sulfotransferase family 2 domain-containing protein [Arenimonas sp.]